jgi:pyruvate dehydrogenase E2 component (dihydrolipoamide acetyltransferase)
MPVNVVMPQMGESIAEGTIVKYFKAVGDPVVKDEPLLEISTDKVDAEVPAPATGTLANIIHGPGTTVPVETVVAVIALPGEAAATPAEAFPAPAPTPPQAPAAQPAPTAPVPAPEVAAPPATATAAPPAEPVDEEAEALRQRSSPLVRRIAREHGVDVAKVPGTGILGRVTRDDIMRFIGTAETVVMPADQMVAAAKTVEAQSAAVQTTSPPAAAPAAPVAPAAPAFAGDELREPMSIMRQRIAEHMVMSRHTSPHVNTVFDVDMSRVMRLRESNKAAFEAKHGLKLTVTPFFLAACVEALKAYPVVNASIDGTTVVHHRHVNLGVAVALTNGLIVPVIKHAEELSLLGLQRAVTDLATRARNKQLKPEEVQGSTFSVTNPGQYGGLFGLPIINQPNVAIMSTGGIHKRPVVVTDELGNDVIAIRQMAMLAMSFDHRLVDGAVADQFMVMVKEVLERASFALG